MTQDVIQMAKKAGFLGFNVEGWAKEFEKFAALVREDERKEQALQRLTDIHQEMEQLRMLKDDDSLTIAYMAGAASERERRQKPVAVVEITYGRDPECYVTGNIDNFPEGVFKLYAAPVDAKAIRAEALEEAAKVCEEVAKHYITNHKEQEQVWLLAATSDCAAAIRARGETK